MLLLFVGLTALPHDVAESQVRAYYTLENSSAISYKSLGTSFMSAYGCVFEVAHFTGLICKLEMLRRESSSNRRRGSNKPSERREGIACDFDDEGMTYLSQLASF